MPFWERASDEGLGRGRSGGETGPRMLGDGDTLAWDDGETRQPGGVDRTGQAWQAALANVTDYSTGRRRWGRWGRRREAGGLRVGLVGFLLQLGAAE